MRLLLLTDIPPSENLTAGLVLADIVRGLPAGSVACFCALNTHLKPVLPSDLHAMPIGVTPKPVESGVQIGRSVLLSRLATIVREAKRRTIDSRRKTVEPEDNSLVERNCSDELAATSGCAKATAEAILYLALGKSRSIWRLIRSRRVDLASDENRHARRSHQKGAATVIINQAIQQSHRIPGSCQRNTISSSISIPKAAKVDTSHEDIA